MNAELSAYRDSIDRRLRAICDGLDGLTPVQLSFRPEFVGANSVWALATHTLGNARAWALGIACRQDVRRDRATEFIPFGHDPATFRSDVEEFTRLMSDGLARLSAEDLDRRSVPSQELWGEGAPREISVREALLQVVEHASLHLGHLHVTRELALSRD